MVLISRLIAVRRSFCRYTERASWMKGRAEVLELFLFADGILDGPETLVHLLQLDDEFGIELEGGLYQNLLQHIQFMAGVDQALPCRWCVLISRMVSLSTSSPIETGIWMLCIGASKGMGGACQFLANFGQRLSVNFRCTLLGGGANHCPTLHNGIGQVATVIDRPERR